MDARQVLQERKAWFVRKIMLCRQNIARMARNFGPVTKT